MKPASERRERIPELDLFRAFAILGVIHVHATSFAAGVQALDSPYYWLFNGVNIFSRFGTPCFIFLSSFVLFYNYLNRPLDRGFVSRFYTRRLLYIIVPYLAASVCYYILGQAVNGTLGQPVSWHLTQLGRALATGTAHTHLYFVFINMQFYVLFPLMLLAFRRLPGLVAWAFPIGLAIEWGFVLWNKYDLHLMNKASYSPTYMSYYMLGLTLAVNFDAFKRWFGRPFRDRSAGSRWGVLLLWAAWLGAALTEVALYYNGRAKGQWVNSLWYELNWNVHTLLSVFVLFHASYWVYRRVSGRIVSALAKLGAASFAIYLLHPAFLFAYRRTRYTLPPESLPYVFWIWAGVPACLFLAWGTAALAYRRIPGAVFLLGSRPSGQSGKRQQAPAGAAGPSGKQAAG